MYHCVEGPITVQLPLGRVAAIVWPDVWYRVCLWLLCTRMCGTEPACGCFVHVCVVQSLPIVLCDTVCWQGWVLLLARDDCMCAGCGIAGYHCKVE